MNTLAGRIIEYFENINYPGSLPEGIKVMNPFRENPYVLKTVKEFFTRFYSDNNPRYMILGINPGRFGAGVTGITFTDTIRLRTNCGVKTSGPESRELSSEFFYQMIERYGGVAKFFSRFYVSAVCPLGFILTDRKGREINYNYYDSRELQESVYNFIVENIGKQLSLGISRDICFCLGTGKNFRFLLDLNEKYSYFKKIVPLEHPRFIMQYRRKRMDLYIEKYIEAFRRL